MKHLGDITKLNVAGLRKGIKHEENGDEETKLPEALLSSAGLPKGEKERPPKWKTP